MSLLLAPRTRLLWPPLKRHYVRPAAREYRVHRNDRRFERYWQRLLRHRRRAVVLRHRPPALTRSRALIPSEIGDSALLPTGA